MDSPVALPIKQANKVVKVRGIFQDITERRKAEEALREQVRLQLQLSQIAATVPGMICSFKLDPDGTVSMPFASAALDEVYGLSADALAVNASSLFDILHPDDLERVSLSISESARTMRPWRMEYRIIHACKGERWIEGHSMPQKQEDGSILWHGFVQDITERKTAEDRLRELQNVLAEAESVAGIGSWKLELTTQKLTWSDEMYVLFGFDKNELDEDIRQMVDACVHADDREAVEQTTELLLTGREPQPMKYRIILPDETQRIVWAEQRLVHDKIGQPVSLFGYVQDITRRKEVEEAKTKLEGQLRQAQKLESIGRLAGGVAHDFNNLLTVIQMYSDLMHTQMDKSDPLLPKLEQIRYATRRATDLTRQLLAFSRKQILTPTVLDLNELIRNLQKMLARLIGEDILLSTMLEPELWSVTADSGQIEQVIMNLALNARDAMPAGGMLTIETSNVQLESDLVSDQLDIPTGPCVLLAVTDTGHGMDEATRQQIFEPFFTTKQTGGGTGLGLATVHGIVKQNKVEAASLSAANLNKAQRLRFISLSPRL